MWLLQLKKLLCLFACIGLTPILFAKDNDAQEIQHALVRMQQAAKKLNYSGTFVYQQANQIRTSRITHVFDGQDEFEKLELLDGIPKEFIRRNDVVTCYLPDTKTIQVERNVTQEAFPALLNTTPKSLNAGYLIRKAEMSRVAGTDCQTLSFEPKDSYRFGYRLCIDLVTGLLLRAQTIDMKNEVIEQIAFTQLSFGDVDKSAIQTSFSHVGHWRTDNVTVQSKAQSGWELKFLPIGFKKTREIKRSIPISLHAPDAPASTNTVSGAATAVAKPELARQQQVVQMIFSDGLSAFSVFIEPASAGRVEGSLQQGAVTIMGKRQGDYWLTVVGEVPFVAIKEVINSIEFKPR